MTPAPAITDRSDAERGQRIMALTTMSNDQDDVRPTGSRRLYAGGPPRLVGVGGPRSFVSATCIDDSLDDLPGEIGEQHDDDGADAAAQCGRQGSIARRDRRVDRPGVGEQESGADEEDGARAALDGAMSTPGTPLPASIVPGGRSTCATERCVTPIRAAGRR